MAPPAPAAVFGDARAWSALVERSVRALEQFEAGWPELSADAWSDVARVQQGSAILAARPTFHGLRPEETAAAGARAAALCEFLETCGPARVADAPGTRYVPAFWIGARAGQIATTVPGWEYMGDVWVPPVAFRCPLDLRLPAEAARWAVADQSEVFLTLYDRVNAPRPRIHAAERFVSAIRELRRCAAARVFPDADAVGERLEALESEVLATAGIARTAPRGARTRHGPARPAVPAPAAAPSQAARREPAGPAGHDPRVRAGEVREPTGRFTAPAAIGGGRDCAVAPDPALALTAPSVAAPAAVAAAAVLVPSVRRRAEPVLREVQGLAEFLERAPLDEDDHVWWAERFGRVRDAACEAADRHTQAAKLIAEGYRIAAEVDGGPRGPTARTWDDVAGRLARHVDAEIVLDPAASFGGAPSNEMCRYASGPLGEVLRPGWVRHDPATGARQVLLSVVIGTG